ncbi:MAG: DNA gyrase C-terminal beta-propeller domain-containing protein, partial [Candidatus Thermoplasmatota archaeon]|nr:DNA gyrase C-terminal beta-propeller domain-containing protein [Candidatus Thermoplasmatota archaeon]
EEGRLLVTEIPYMVNKSKLLQDIAGLVRDKKLEGIRDLRDESSQEGIRVLIDLKRGANPEIVKNQLFQMTQLQTSFGINNVSLVNNEPKVLTLRDMIAEYITHRLEVIVRRTEHLLAKAEERAHILEGLLVALENIDAIIETIRESDDTAGARESLMETFELSEEQARAILDMRLARLTRLEGAKIQEELDGLRADIEEYNAILSSEDRRRSVIQEELLELKEQYDDERRTEIRAGEGDLLIEDLIPDEPVVIQLTQSGYIKRVNLEAYRTQGRGGRGVVGMRTKDEDHVVDVFTCTNHQRILLVTQNGIVHDLKAYQIPEGDRYARGVPVVSLLERLEPGTEVQAALPVEAFTEDDFLFFATREGKVKKTPLSEYEQINVNGKIAIRLNEGDELVGVAITNGENEIILVKDSGKGVRFHEEQVRPMGRVAAGVKGTELRGEEQVVSMVVIRDPEASLLTVTARGKGKRTPFDSYNAKNRGVWGVYMHGTSNKTGPVVGALEVSEDDEVLFTSKNGVIIRSRAQEISTISTGQAQGVIVQRLEDDDETVAVARLAPEIFEEDEEEGDEPDEEADEAAEVEAEE